MNAFLNNVFLLKFILINVLDIVFYDLPFFSIFVIYNYVVKHNHNSLILTALMVSIPLNKYTTLKLPKLLLIENLVWFQRKLLKNLVLLIFLYIHPGGIC